MRKVFGLVLFVVLTLLLASPALAAPTWDRNPRGFKHGIAVTIEGGPYYFKGPGSVEGAVDVPGHTWVQTGPYRVKGRHYNVGPLALAGVPWWATVEPYGVLLYVVDGIIDVPPDELSEEREARLKARGYVHIHEFVDEHGDELEDYVIYLKHTAVTEFYFNGGPAAPDTNHMVNPGIDYEFMPNW